MTSIKKKIRDCVHKQNFFPGVLGIFINPFYFARKGLAEQIRKIAGYVTGKTLDIGCGTKPYKQLFQSTEYIGLELDTKTNREHTKADYFYDGYKLPFDNEEFDSIVMNEVFEHVFNPDDLLTEVYRVLKPEGVLLLTTPFVWDEHTQPYDYARYSSFGLKYLLEKHDFVIVSYEKSMNDIRVIFQMINAYIYKKVITKNRYIINRVLVLLLIAPFNLTGELLAKITPSNNDLYLDNVVLARKTVCSQQGSQAI